MAGRRRDLTLVGLGDCGGVLDGSSSTMCSGAVVAFGVGADEVVSMWSDVWVDPGFELPSPFIVVTGTAEGATCCMEGVGGWTLGMGSMEMF